MSLHFGSLLFRLLLVLDDLVEHLLSFVAGIVLESLIDILIPPKADFGLFYFDCVYLIEIAVIDAVEAEGLDDIDHLVPSLLLADPALLLVDLENGLAGGDVDIGGSGDFLDVLAVIKDAIDDGLPHLL
jgi:hypothetical protein